MAEFGLLDAQLANLTKLVAETTGEEAEDGVDGLVIDEDELEVTTVYVHTLLPTSLGVVGVVCTSAVIYLRSCSVLLLPLLLLLSFCPSRRFCC